jgi:hypothetical protein
MPAFVASEGVANVQPVRLRPLVISAVEIRDHPVPSVVKNLTPPLDCLAAQALSAVGGIVRVGSAQDVAPERGWDWHLKTRLQRCHA